MSDVEGTEWAAITTCYGTDAAKVSENDLPSNLLIPAAEFRALGLHKPTVFKLDLRNRNRLPWAEEYFVPPEYVRNRGIIAGSLNMAQQESVLAGLKARNLAFPLPQLV